jgi:hypothetical protein
MAGEDFKLENRFSSSRGLFPYVLAALGAVVVVVLFMIVTGIGRDRLPYSDYFFAVRAPEAADGSEALSLMEAKFMEDGKTVVITGSVGNRTEKPISGLIAVIAVTDKYTLPVQTVNVPIDPAELAPKAMGMFQTTVPLAEHGFGGFTIQFRLPEPGPFVPHKDERPLDIPQPTIEAKPTK